MPKQSGLFEFHSARGAVFAQSDEWLLPMHYGNTAGEYETVRQSAGIIDFSHRALLQFTGDDRLSFLQGMLSNDLRSLTNFEGQYAAILNQQGKVLADLRVLCAMNSIYLDFWESLKEKILAHLTHYLVADEVEIHDRSEDYAILSLQGPRAEALVTALAPGAELPKRKAHHVMLNADGAAICAVRDSHSGETGFDLIIPRADLVRISQRLTDIGGELAAGWVGQEALEILRIEAGIPRYGTDLTEDNLLLETGLDTHVSFTKGCYLGQEIVERVRSRGHVNRKLCGLLLEGKIAARRGDGISAGDRQTGSITSSVYSPSLSRPVALGYVHREHWASGTQLTVHRNGTLVNATVTDLPFVSPRQGLE
jgi:folate-binding protein YgfZ